MSSKAQIAANRRNAKKSTGPSEAAKAWTRLNGLKHGLRAQTQILPNEDPQELQELKETWVNSLMPRDPAEDELVLDVVNAYWLHRRAERAVFEHLKAPFEQADEREEDRVAVDIKRLFRDARGPHPMYALSSANCGGPYTSSTTEPEDPNDPSKLVKGLEASEKGCRALIGHWRMLRERLESGFEWQSQDRLKGIRMLGRQPVEVVEDQRVWMIYVGSFALHPAGKDNAFLDLKADMGAIDFAAFLERIRSRWPLLLDASDTPKARQTLFDLVDRNLERLEAKVEVYREHAAERAARRSAPPTGDEVQERERLQRYELASHRRAHRCLDAFWKYRREMGDGAEDGGRRADFGELSRAEDGGEQIGAENATEAKAETGVAIVESKVENKNLTTDANGGFPASEAEMQEQIAVMLKAMEQSFGALSAQRDLVLGAIGTGVAGDGNGRSAIEDILSSGKPLIPPIS